MRLIGPNCMGLINTDPEVSLNAQFSPFAPLPGRIGFLSQSGALGIAIIDHANQLGLGLSTFASVGNKADISGNDLIQYWEDDDRTAVILLYLELFGNPRKFARIARRVARKKPIVAVKGGRSSAGFRAAQSHTGVLVATSDITVDALFHQSGVIRTDTLEEMFDVAALLVTQPIPKGNGVGIITNASGLGILTADACENLGLRVPELSPGTQASLRAFLPSAAGIRNPIDLVASVSDADYERSIRTVAADPEVDAVIVLFIPPIAVRREDVGKAIVRAARNLNGQIPVLTVFMGSNGLTEQLREGDIRLPAYSFPESAAHALAKVARYGTWLAAPEGDPPRFPDVQREEAVMLIARRQASSSDWLSPGETETLLACYGIPVVRTVRAGSPEAAGQAAADLGIKVALKAVVPGVTHKTEVGAVRLNLEGRREVEQEAQAMRDRLTAAGLQPTGFIVQPMVAPGVEMFIGVTHDPHFGPVVACGAGGVLVELLRDIAVRVTPLTDRDAREMLRSLKTFPLLEGYRGGPRYDIERMEEMILRVAALIEDVSAIVELDLNPVMALPEGQGISVVDARVRVGESAPPTPSAQNGRDKATVSLRRPNSCCPIRSGRLFPPTRILPVRVC